MNTNLNYVHTVNNVINRAFVMMCVNIMASYGSIDTNGLLRVSSAILYLLGYKCVRRVASPDQCVLLQCAQYSSFQTQKRALYVYYDAFNDRKCCLGRQQPFPAFETWPGSVQLLLTLALSSFTNNCITRDFFIL